MRIAVVIVHFGDKRVTKACLHNLRHKLGRHEVILVNNSAEEIQDLVEIIPRTTCIDNRRNGGFAKAVNQGLRNALEKNDIGAVFLLNNDAEITHGSLDQLALTFITKKDAGIVAPVLFHGGSFYDWGGTLSKITGLVKHANFTEKPKTILSVESVPGAAMMVKRDVIEKAGLFDERFFMYYEDDDYCLRVRSSGYSVHINPEIVVSHGVSKSSRPWERTLFAWKSHILFVTKYVPRTMYVSAFITDCIYYPLIFFKSLLVR